MKTLLENPSPTPQLIIDAENYAQTVLLQGKAIPWHEATAYANHLKQTVALLKPRAIVINLDKMIKQELTENTTLTQAMGAKTRTGYALKTFMSDETFKTAAGSLISTASKMLQQPIIVQLPSPLEILHLTAQAAQADTDNEFNDDDAENTAVYYADWLRAFTEAKISGLIFDERTHSSAEQSYQPIKNTAENYQWIIGMRRENTLQFISPQATLEILPSDYWLTGAPSSQTGTLFTEIPPNAIPEKVLDYITHFQ